MLNRFFSVADDLAQQCHCEKIKTIGDCVMAAAGVPEASANHAETLARYALDLRAAMQGEMFAGQPLRLRIGIHSGPAVAGVIGHNRFAYDLWGDTVNVAARIEHAAKVGEICVSDSTRKRLGMRFLCPALGEVEARGAGRMVNLAAGLRAEGRVSRDSCLIAARSGLHPLPFSLPVPIR